MTDTLSAPPDATGRFGEFGGRFVPETLVPACQELEAAFDDAWADPEFRTELTRVHTQYSGRPSIMTECHNLGERLGIRLILKREDLNHTGSHKINNVIGQTLLAKRMGKKRIVADTGAGQHGVASATAAALMGLECKVYMGAVDVERQALNVFRMKLLGAEVESVQSGSRTLKDAVNEAMRHWVANVTDTHFCLGSVVGPHPYPFMVRQFQSIIGDEAHEQIHDDDRLRCPTSSSRASAAGRTRWASSPDSSTSPASASSASSRPGARRSAAARPAWSTVSRSYLMQDEVGQVEEALSISAGLDYPGVGPEHSYLAADRTRRVSERHRRRGDRGVPAAVGDRGHHPGARVRPRGGLDQSRAPRRCRARRC